MMFALTLGSRPSPDNILMLLAERGEADEIAAELKRHGQLVQVLEVDCRTDWVTSAVKGSQLRPSTEDPAGDRQPSHDESDDATRRSIR